MKAGKTIMVLAIAVLAASWAGCEFTGDGTTTVVSTVTVTATATAPREELALGRTLTLETVSSSESSQNPKYSLEINKPVLKGSSDARVDQFNQLVDALVDRETASFKSDAASYSGSGSGSTLKLNYTLKSPPGQIISLLFSNNIYFSGAAHGGTIYQTLNYDLTTGRSLTLAQLFLPGTAYLQQVANYCKTELSRQGRLEFPAGAEPAAENYQYWTLTATGIEITFPEYQVAPYALGPSTVLVPYSQLPASLDPAGPVALIRK